jgi:hypothetical protein
MGTKPARITDEAYAAMEKARGEMSVTDFLSSSVISAANDPSKLGANAPTDQRQITLDESIKLAKLEGLQVGNQIKKIQLERMKLGTPRVIRDKIEMEASEKNGVATVGEPREKPKGEAIYCYEVGCGVTFAPGLKTTRDNHMIEAHSWTFEMLQAMRAK